MKRPAHYSGDFDRRSRNLRAAATADTTTTCYRCGKTLANHAPHRNGKPAYWTADHINPGDPASPLAPAASTCNYSHGARLRNNQTQLHTTRNW